MMAGADRGEASARNGAPSLDGEGRLGVVAQVRLGSTRLPRKALLPLAGATMTDHVLSRLARIPAAVHILATDEASAAELGPVAARQGFALLVGPAEDVLARYCKAIREYHLDLVIRATGDNPLVSWELARLLIQRRAELAAAARAGRGRAPDFLAHDGMPLGMGVELVRAGALLEAEAEALLPHEREHVCPFIYGHPERFAIDRSPAPVQAAVAWARLTVDDRADFERVEALYAALYRGEPIPDSLILTALGSARAQAGVA